MDPFTIAALTAGGLGVVQGIGNSFSNNPSQKLNAQKLEELMALQRAGGLGLSSVEQRLMAQQAVDPVRREATQATRRAEQLSATAGTSSAGQLAGQQMKQAAVVGDAVGQATQQIALADQQKRQQQMNEIEARTAAKSGYAADDVNNVFGAAGQLAGPLGMAAGGPPGMTQLGPLFGQQFRGVSIPNEEMAMILELIGKDPTALERIKALFPAGG
jgi:hypothetical protein